MTVNGKRRGRPSLFKPEYVEQARKLCLLGHTDFEIAQFFDVTDRCFYKWKAQYPELVQALNIGKEEADRRVTRSLYSRAVGYNYDAVKIFLPAGSKQPVVVHYVEHIPPDVTAGIFWLKNRDPQHWRDSQQLEHVLGRYIISDQPMTEEQWARERATVIDAEPVKDLPKSKQCCPNVVMGIGLLVGSIIISNGYSYADCDPMAERGGRLAGTAGRLDPSAEGQRGQK